jgi:hypothetical protein
MELLRPFGALGGVVAADLALKRQALCLGPVGTTKISSEM